MPFGKDLTLPPLALAGLKDLKLAEGSRPKPPVGKMLDEICVLVSHLTQAPTVLVAQRDPDNKRILVRGKTGTLVTEVDMSFGIPHLNPERSPVLVSPDVRSDPRFAGHPLLNLMPHLRSLMVLLIPGTDLPNRSVLKIVNPRKSAMQDAALMRALSDISILIADILHLDKASDAGEETQPDPAAQTAAATLSQHSAFAETFVGNTEPASLESVSAFLLETLVRKRGLHSRGGVDYVSLRTWRSTIKKYQVIGVTALKAGLPKEFICRVAQEIVASVRQSHGEQVIRSVVPVPPGSSGGSESLSTRIGAEVARQLGARYCNVLQQIGPVELGRSSPRKSARHGGYTLTGQPEGPILVVDDVASSGRHIELAVKTCKQIPGVAVYAITWVSN